MSDIKDEDMSMAAAAITAATLAEHCGPIKEAEQAVDQLTGNRQYATSELSDWEAEKLAAVTAATDDYRAVADAIQDLGAIEAGRTPASDAFIAAGKVCRGK